jgi:hypothetical protein
LPYRLVEMEGFRIFMKLVCPKWVPIGRYEVQKIINEMNRQSENAVQKFLQASKFLSVTADIWTDRRGRAYLGVTVHAIGKKFGIKSVVIALQVFDCASHTGVSICDKLISILRKVKFC